MVGRESAPELTATMSKTMKPTMKTATTNPTMLSTTDPLLTAIRTFIGYPEYVLLRVTCQ